MSDGLTVTKVNRYKCVHCGRAGYSAGHMRKHAQRCTMNPDRTCGMHYMEHFFEQGRRFSGYEVKDQLQAAIQAIPDPAKFYQGEDEFGIGKYPGLEEALRASMSSVSELVNGCPACILAVLRQRKIPWHVGSGFQYKEAADKWKDEASKMCEP